MRPKKQKTTGQGDLFRARLDQFSAWRLQTEKAAEWRPSLCCLGPKGRAVACNRPIIVRYGTVWISTIADCQNFPVFWEKYPAHSSGQVVAEFAIGWGIARAGVRLDEVSAWAVGVVHSLLIPNHR